MACFVPSRVHGAPIVVLALASACGGAGADASGDASADATLSVGTITATGDGSSGATSSGNSASLSTSVGPGTADETSDLPKLDVLGPSRDAGVHPPSCVVVDDMNAVPPCDDIAPPDSFEPDVQWSFAGDGTYTASYVTPLVANFTDDNADGAVDLCDVPDIVLTLFGGGGGRMVLLDGATGTMHFAFPGTVSQWTTPALGDIDGDGLVEVVAAQLDGPSSDSPIVAFEHDGTAKWTSTETWDGPSTMNGSIALADLDNDGSVEIIAGNLVLDADGGLVAEFPYAPSPTLGWRPSAAVPADLDDDGDLEVVLGTMAYHHDGAVHYDVGASFEFSGFPHIADLDDDGLPEVLLTTKNGVSLLEHDGTITWQDLRPTGDTTDHLNWARPAAIHDFDGDDVPNFALSSGAHYSVFETDASVVWTANVADGSGISSGTAFDFLGDGVAEAMYTDEQMLYVYDGGTGAVLLQTPRQSPTIVEYPVVADVDNDGSAEILVVSTSGAPPLQVIRDVEERWIQARRIWNEHVYHVTNVREDGTIPQFEPPHWTLLNTFRTQAQISGADGGVCDPEG